MFPLTTELAGLLETVAEKYSDLTVRFPEQSHWSIPRALESIVNMRLWLLRYYREEGLEEKWQRVRQDIGDDFESLLPEHRARLSLEVALHALYGFNPAEARRLLIEWEGNEHLPFWEAKRAALMAELGEVSAARSILEKSLSVIRRQQSLKPVGDDYTLVSQESVVMLLLWAVEIGSSVSERSRNDGDLSKEMSERWNELTRYKCDPRREIDALSARLTHPPATAPRREESTSNSYDLGMTSRTVYFGSDQEAITAYGLLRLCEDIGLPYQIGSATFVNAPVKATLPRVGPYSPHWALANVVRLGDAKAADWLFNREYVVGLARGDVDRFFDVYLLALERAVAMTDGHDQAAAKTFDSLAKTLPEVFSRLSYKCSPVYRERLVQVLRNIYSSERKRAFAEVSRFAHRLFDSMSVEEGLRAVPTLLDFPVPKLVRNLEKQEYLNPLRFLSLPQGAAHEVLEVDEKTVDQLLARLADRDWASEWVTTSLAWLHGRGKLNARQSEIFGRLLWEGVEPHKTPTIPGFYGFACVSLPHPAGIAPGSRAKAHLKSMVSEAKGTSGLDDVLEELRQSTGLVDWSPAEVSEILGELVGWWAENKTRLTVGFPMAFGSPADRTRATIRRIIAAISEMVARLPWPETDGLSRDVLRDFVSDLRAHGVVAASLEMAMLVEEADGRSEVLVKVVDQMLDSDRDRVVDALLGASLLAAATEQGSQNEFAEVGKALAQGVEWRHRPALVERLRLVAGLIRDHSWYLSAETESSLLRGLEQLAVETSPGDVKGNDNDGVILRRAAAASVAFEFARHCHRSEREEPEAIGRWRNICADPDEFAEVSNAWKITEV